jgi:hypothetical protein
MQTLSEALVERSRIRAFKTLKRLIQEGAEQDIENSEE